LVKRLNPQKVLVLGDLAYDNGSSTEFANGYGPTWGAFKSKSFPVPGNHEYNTAGAQPYKAWWGSIARPNGTTWHSTRIGGWLVLGLDSNCGDAAVGGCGPDSPQGKWLAGQLARSPRCVIAIWHHPRRSSGVHGDNSSVAPLWQQLANAHADLVLQGHDHDYERFAPADANANPAKVGMVGMVVGTGGKQPYPFLTKKQGSLMRVQGVHGVVALDLHQRGWAWRFTGTDGKVRDKGTAACRA
jgi:alkaline phosphatase